MEKKNTVLLTVIAVATLLVAVVGATFAYFTATTKGTGEGTATTGTATSIGSVELKLATTTNTADITYPGGMMVNGASVTATVDGEGTFGATYTINAEVDATGLSSANTQVKYTLYRTNAALTTDALSGCELQTQTNAADATKTEYFYTGCTASTEITGGTAIASDTITDLTQKATISVADQSFSGLTSTDTASNYYYLVVEYLNNTEAEQNDDMGGSISARITEVTNANSTATE